MHCRLGEKKKQGTGKKHLRPHSPTYEFTGFTLIEFLIRKFYKRGAFMDNFSQRVKEARTTKKLTQKELAERIGTTESNINNYEKGRNKPTTDMLVKICLELDVSADWLLGLPSKSNTENEAM